MTDSSKKFTFGFSKVVKKSNLVAPPPVTKEKTGVQFIDCLEAKSIKLKNGDDEEKEKAPLVIPIVGPRKSSTLINEKSIAEAAEDFSDVSIVKKEKEEEPIKGDLPSDSIEAQAVREILQEGADSIREAPPSTLESLPPSDRANQEYLQKESSLEDYENVPVEQYGLAMLRGMGWKPDEGIGKNKKLVAVTAPVLRPKGMGLGADKVIKAAPASKMPGKNDEEELKMVKGAYVKVTAGMHKEQYAQIEGFSDDSGRVILKMAIGGHVVSVIEPSLQLVSKTEYSKNSKVLNATKFDAFKKNEETGKKFTTQQEAVKIRSLANDQDKNNFPPKVERMQSSERPNKSKLSKDSSQSPVRSNRKRSKSPDRKKRYQSRSPDSKKRYQSRSPDRKKRYESKSPDRKKRYKSRTPERKIRQPSRSPDRRRRSHSRSPRRKRDQSPSVSRRRTRSRSRSRDYYVPSKKASLDSDSDSDNYNKKKKRKHKEKKRKERYSSSPESSRSRSRSPKKKRKHKKSRRSHSKSPVSRKKR